jgi:hypothetical protein
MEALGYTFNGAQWTMPASTAAPVPVYFDEAAVMRALLALRADARPALIKFVLDCLYRVIRQMGVATDAEGHNDQPDRANRGDADSHE